MEPLNQLDGLEIKLRQLAAKMDRQRAAYEALVAENEQLKRDFDRQLGVVNSLKDKLERSQQQLETTGAATTASAPIPAANGQQQREAIDFCIKEIDRCIDWMQRN
jgi:predicted nuclease with TOPRIM domain